MSSTDKQYFARQWDGWGSECYMIEGENVATGSKPAATYVRCMYYKRKDGRIEYDYHCARQPLGQLSQGPDLTGFVPTTEEYYRSQLLQVTEFFAGVQKALAPSAE